MTKRATNSTAVVSLHEIHLATLVISHGFIIGLLLAIVTLQALAQVKTGTSQILSIVIARILPTR